MNKMTLSVALLAAMLAIGASTEASAQKRKVPAKPAAAQPATPDEGEKPVSGETGTTIVGEQESPIGLYITPWKDEYAERGMDRPARLLDEELLPIDKATFSRQVEYFDKIAAYRKAKLAAGESIR